MAYSVMIVDDSAAMRKFIRRVLILSGLEIGECMEAGDGRQALDVLRDHWVDIVLTDINMPNMNGEEFMQHLAADSTLSSTPVLVVSTDKSEVRMKRMMALGARGYVTKPLHPETLGRVMQELLTGDPNAGN